MPYDQILKVSDWIKDRQSTIDREQLTIERVAELATQELQFEVSTSSIVKIAKARNVVCYEPPTPAVIEQQRLDNVVKTLAELYEKLGEQIPDDFKQIVSQLKGTS